MLTSPLTHPIFNMDDSNSYNDISPTEGSFEYPLHDSDGYGESELFIDPLAGHVAHDAGSPYNTQQYSGSYVQEYNASNMYPSPATDADSPGTESSSAPLPYHQHSRASNGSITSLASSATAVSFSEAAGSIAADSIKTEASDASAAATITPAAKPPAKRKRENRYKNASPSVLSRRRAQNRASQRAYRERKDQRIRDLETQLGDTNKQLEFHRHSCEMMQTEIYNLRMQLNSQAGHAHSALSVSAAQMSSMQIRPPTVMTSASLAPAVTATAGPAATLTTGTADYEHSTASIPMVAGGPPLTEQQLNTMYHQLQHQTFMAPSFPM